MIFVIRRMRFKFNVVVVDTSIKLIFFKMTISPRLVTFRRRADNYPTSPPLVIEIVTTMRSSDLYGLSVWPIQSTRVKTMFYREKENVKLGFHTLRLQKTFATQTDIILWFLFTKYEISLTNVSRYSCPCCNLFVPNLKLPRKFENILDNSKIKMVQCIIDTLLRYIKTLLVFQMYSITTQ